VFILTHYMFRLLGPIQIVYTLNIDHMNSHAIHSSRTWVPFSYTLSNWISIIRLNSKTYKSTYECENMQIMKLIKLNALCEEVG
jgi:hypothetical protein